MTGEYRGRVARPNDTFNFDPSTLRDEFTSTIPQALFLMNSPRAGGAVDGQGRTSLARMLSEIRDDEALTVELYLRCFSRHPKPSEIKTCLAYIREVRNRKEAFEDILWSLINSAEFRYRR